MLSRVRQRHLSCPAGAIQVFGVSSVAFSSIAEAAHIAVVSLDRLQLVANDRGDALGARQNPKQVR